jgi:hypothetical protein
MLLAVSRHRLAKRCGRVLQRGLLAIIVVSLWSPGASAQTCAVSQNGQSRGQCLNPGAKCKSGAVQGICTNSGPKGEYECDCKTPPPPPPTCKALNVCPAKAPLANHLFYIQDLGGSRCIDAGPLQSWVPGSPVFINACNHTNGQEIQVSEINSNDNDHDVGLSVYPIPTNAPPSTRPAVTAPTAPGSTSTGGTTNIPFCIGVHGGTVAPGAALELQSCNASSPAQRFALDGDAILMGLQTSGKVTREFVIERANGSTVPQTPLVVATRDLAEEKPLRIDARYFRFNAVDSSGATPTSGFLTVADQAHLVCALQCGWGTVVQIDDQQPLELTSLPYPGIEVADGTTVRGYRSGTYNGPQVQTCVISPVAAELSDDPVFLATGKGVRFTGFRLHGPHGDSTCGQKIAGESASEPAIEVRQDGPESLPVIASPVPRVWVDHMEISHWPDAGVFVAFPDFGGNPDANPTPCMNCAYPNTPVAMAVGNFLHDNLYGVNSGGGLFSQTRASVLYGQANQPVTSGEGSCLGGYAAMDNLLLTEAGVCSNDKKCSSDDVDMHGSRPPHHWSEGLAGDYFDVGWNTFLRTNVDYHIANVNQRGYSCRFIKVHNNVFLQSEGSAIRDPFNPPADAYDNIFNAQDPTQGLLLVGDFDGDKIDDVFLATGAVWYYSSGGQAEWRYLNRASEPASALLLGDFDGDGRTDVLTVHGPNIDVSWAGVSAWQTINGTAGPLSDLAVGDFDGDGRSDLLLATGQQWVFASGGQNWQSWATPYTDTIPNLRFGHFTDKTKTQILRVQKGHWQLTELGMTSWNDLGEAPVDSVNGLVAGDFNGDGYTELAQSGPVGWVYTSPGRNNSWSTPVLGPIQNLPIGNFQGGKQDGVIVWSDNHFYFTQACTTDHPCAQKEPQLLSRQVMR